MYPQRLEMMGILVRDVRQGEDNSVIIIINESARKQWVVKVFLENQFSGSGLLANNGAFELYTPSSSPASVPPSEAVKASPAKSNDSIKLINIGERRAEFSSRAICANILRHGYGSKEERSDDVGWRDWVMEDVVGYFVQEELYLPKVDVA
ncbi:hypothetical protein BDQ17DRAFT_1425983 [Cyathus striatus]|nr:hypothetical protein BDQ17DRAFT_1425983 [Cyathus striatus]